MMDVVELIRMDAWMRIREVVPLQWRLRLQRSLTNENPIRLKLIETRSRKRGETEGLTPDSSRPDKPL